MELEAHEAAGEGEMPSQVGLGGPGMSSGSGMDGAEDGEIAGAWIEVPTLTTLEGPQDSDTGGQQVLPHVSSMFPAAAVVTKLKDRSLRLDSRRKSKADPNHENPRKRPRKSYSDQDKQLLVQADAEKGRKGYLEVAKTLGIRPKTADNIVSKARGGKPHAARDMRSACGHNTRFSSLHQDVMLTFLHLNASLTLKQLRQAINREVLRNIVLMSGVQILDGEQAWTGPLSSTEYLSNEDIQRQYSATEIKSHQTVANWLTGLVCTKKHVIPDNQSANLSSAMLERLMYARQLKSSINASNTVLIFVDEMPFSLTIRQPIRDAAAEGSARTSETVTYRAQVGTAISPELGMVHNSVFPPGKKIRVASRGASNQTTLIATWGTEEKTLFWEGVIASLFEYGAELEEKRIALVFQDDGDSNKGADVQQMLSFSSNYSAFQAFLVGHGCKLGVIKMAKESPQLNPCEIFNRLLRTQVNNMLRNEETVHELEACSHADERVSLLEALLRKGIDALKSSDALAETSAKFHTNLDAVITNNGYLNVFDPGQ